jgi:DNA-binding CsgD family transcriptional regulator
MPRSPAALPITTIAPLPRAPLRQHRAQQARQRVDEVREGVAPFVVGDIGHRGGRRGQRRLRDQHVDLAGLPHDALRHAGLVAQRARIGDHARAEVAEHALQRRAHEFAALRDQDTPALQIDQAHGRSIAPRLSLVRLQAMNDRIRELAFFLRVSEGASFSAAARALDLDPSTISKVIQRLENRLGVRLFHRTSRVLQLTQEGEQFLAAAPIDSSASSSASITFCAAARNCSPSWVSCSTRDVR